VRTVQECIDEEEDMTDSCSGVGGRRELEADSGISRTDDSLRNDESSEQEMIDTDSASPSSGSAKYTAVYLFPMILNFVPGVRPIVHSSRILCARYTG